MFFLHPGVVLLLVPIFFFFLFILPLSLLPFFFFSFFFNDTATPEIYTLSLHDALPISMGGQARPGPPGDREQDRRGQRRPGDRKSTRLNSSHLVISYAVFCLKKKKRPSQTQCIRYRTRARSLSWQSNY